jgi:MFS family permease
MSALNKNIVALGANSFFTDFSTEMILPLLPLFLDRFLHATKGEIGLIEGSAELGVALLIALSGFYSDWLGKRKILTVVGYGLSNLIKPFAFFAQTSAMIATVRIADRIGKGIRSAPRDALISQSTSKEVSGFVFGFHKMMDSAGAVAGSLSAFGLLYFLGESEASFRTVFALSLIPGLIALVILVLFVSDAPVSRASMQRFRPSMLSAPFYWLVASQSLFSLFAMNYSFMILKAGDNGMALAIIPLAYTLYNLVISLFAIPIGRMADRFGKVSLLAFVYMAFGLGAFAMSWGTIFGAWIGFFIYGLFAGGFNSLAKAIISDLVSKELKASAYGVYYTCIGIATFISLSAGGWIWDSFGSAPLFSIAALAAICLSLFLFAFRKKFVEV